MGEGNPGDERQNVAAQPDRMARLRDILDTFEITIAEANDLVVLSDYEIVIIADDSGSMSMASLPPAQRKLGEPTPTRWDELKQTCALLVELATCFDENGVDLYFLNRPKLANLMSASDPSFIAAFDAKPSGSTPLTECLSAVAAECGGERPVLLFILTDGEPNGGPRPFCHQLKNLVKKVSTSHTFRVQIMACTDDESAVGWLNELDGLFTEVDVTDDFYSERNEVLTAKKVSKFTRGDWLIKALLGPVSEKFDAWDEGGPGPSKATGSSVCTLL